MTIRTSGLELKAFYADPSLWAGPEGQPLYWVDGVGLAINGGDILDDADIPALADTDQVDILTGFVYAYEHLGEVTTLEAYFQCWRNGLAHPPLPAYSHRQAAGLLGSLLG